MYRKEFDMHGIEHYYAVNFELPMTLSMYYFDTSTHTIKNMFNWEPVEGQWWITGFTGQIEEFKMKPAERMGLIGSVDFSEHPEIYEGMKEYFADENNKDEEEKYFIFDDVSKVVWIHYERGIRY